MVFYAATNVARVLKLVWRKYQCNRLLFGGSFWSMWKKTARFLPPCSPKSFLCSLKKVGGGVEALGRVFASLAWRRKGHKDSEFVCSNQPRVQHQNRSCRQRLDSDVPFTVAACVVLCRYSVELWGWGTQTKNKTKWKATANGQTTCMYGARNLIYTRFGSSIKQSAAQLKFNFA